MKITSHTDNRGAPASTSCTHATVGGKHLFLSRLHWRLCNVQEALAQMHNRVSNFGLPEKSKTKFISTPSRSSSLPNATLFLLIARPFVGSMSWKYFVFADSCAKKTAERVGNFQEFVFIAASRDVTGGSFLIARPKSIKNWSRSRLGNSAFDFYQWSNRPKVVVTYSHSSS